MSVLDDIKSRRNRTKVPRRDTSLVKAAEEASPVDRVAERDDIDEESITAQSINSSAETTSPESKPIEDSTAHTGASSIVEQIEAELSQFPEIARRSNIRVDADLLQRLEQTCNSHKITLETFLEAAYVLFETQQDIQEPIIKEAQQRKSDRRRAGKLRQDLARLKNY